MKENLLIEQLSKSSTSALKKIIDSYSGYVRTVIRNFSQNMLSKEDIDEMTADVFYRLWRQREHLLKDAGLRPYLSAAARNAVKNRMRSNGIKTVYEDISELEVPLDYYLEEAVEHREMMECLFTAIKDLKDIDQEIFVRFYFYGDNTVHIAEILGLTECNVNTKLHRIRCKLKKYLTERGYNYA